MSLTENEITAGRTYTVVIDQGLSSKRFRDAVALVKGIDGRVVGLVYAPGHPKAYKTGYYESDAAASAKYDGATQTWTVTVPDGGGYPLNDLRNLVSAYGATVDVATEDAPAAAGRPAAARQARPQVSAWGRASGLTEAEYGDGYTASERRALGGQ